MIVVISLVAGCERDAEHNPAFVGKWKSGLPVSAGFVPDNLSNADQMNARIQESVREKNASGEQGVELDLRADGTFTMRVWMDMTSGLFDYGDPDNPAVQGAQEAQDHSVNGTWQSEGNEIHLTSTEGFLPYAFTQKTRVSRASSYGASSSLTRSSQFLPLVLRSNGRLSQFPDANVRPGTHERGLDFVRVAE
ncbi:MAG: hypothetical protein AMXMBFR82_46230 [Candidatus Hydrogenedentota bacterium]